MPTALPGVEGTSRGLQGTLGSFGQLSPVPPFLGRKILCLPHPSSDLPCPFPQKRPHPQLEHGVHCCGLWEGPGPGTRCKPSCSEGGREEGNGEGGQRWKGRGEKKGAALEFPPHTFQTFPLIKSKGRRFFK